MSCGPDKSHMTFTQLAFPISLCFCKIISALLANSDFVENIIS